MNSVPREVVVVKLSINTFKKSDVRISAGSLFQTLILYSIKVFIDISDILVFIDIYTFIVYSIYRHF